MKGKYKVHQYEPLRDIEGQFIPYCTYHAHPGILRPEVYPECQERACRHYQRFQLVKLDGLEAVLKGGKC